MAGTYQNKGVPPTNYFWAKQKRPSRLLEMDAQLLLKPEKFNTVVRGTCLILVNLISLDRYGTGMELVSSISPCFRHIQELKNLEFPAVVAVRLLNKSIIKIHRRFTGGFCNL